MPNEIQIKIKVDNDTAAGFDETLAEARKFAAKIKEVLDEAANIKVNVDADEAKVKIKEVEDELARLNGDDATVKIKVKEEDVKEEVEKVKTELKDGLKDDGGAGKNWSKSLMASIQNFDFKPGLMPVGIAIGAAFAPLLGASIAGLIVGGLGLGGIVGGVIVATRDARVRTAFADMRTDLGNSLKVDAAPFVPVVINGIKSIETAVDGIDIKGIFKDLAPQAQPLLNGVLDMITELGGAIRNVAANSGPVIKELGTDFRNFGNSLTAGINSLTDNGKQEAQALHDLFAAIDGGITLTFDLVNALTEVYGAFHKIIDLSPIGFYELMQDHSQKLSGAVHEQVSAVLAAVDANGSLSDSARAAADAEAAQAAATKKASDALKAATDPAFALLDAQKQVNDAQDTYNKAVKTGGANSKTARDAQAALDKAYVGLVGALAGAKGGTDHLTDAQKQMLRTAGASAATIRDLDAQLKAAYAAAKKLDGFRVDVTVAYSYKTYGAPRTSVSPYDFHGLATGGIKGAATGATSSGLTWVGENGPELMSLPAGTAVRSHGDSMRQAGGMDAAGGPQVIELHVDGHVLARVMADPQRKFVQQNFGGSVQKAYGVGA